MRELTLFPHKYFAFCQKKRYIEDGNSPRKQFNSIKMMNRKVLFWPLAEVLLTACEKGLGAQGVCPLVSKTPNLQLVLRPLFIEVCGIFSGRLGQDNACTIYKLYNILILYNSENVSLCTDYRLQFA